jgi:hypothetical protein
MVRIPPDDIALLSMEMYRKRLTSCIYMDTPRLPGWALYLAPRAFKVIVGFQLETAMVVLPYRDEVTPRCILSAVAIRIFPPHVKSTWHITIYT